jgi:uncharacterized protein DUF4382
MVALCIAGCNNTCVSVALNSPNGSTVNIKAGSPPPSCSLSTANGIVRLEIGAASGATSTPGVMGPHLNHLYVTVTGIEAHSSPLAADDTPGWKALAPQLQKHPIQVDLLADAHANASSAPFADAVLPTGAYRQIRLRLASLSVGESVLEGNLCGAGTPHCAVASEGGVWPLAFPPSRPDLRIVLDSLPGHGLYVPPDGLVGLVIELDGDRSWIWPSGNSLLFAPVFHVSIQDPPNFSEIDPNTPGGIYTDPGKRRAQATDSEL